MAMVNDDGSSLYWRSQESKLVVGWLGLRVGGQLALRLYSLKEAGELLQWPHHDDSNINIYKALFTIKSGIENFAKKT